MRPDQPFSMALVALTVPGYIGLIVTAFMAPFRMRGSPLRFAPLAMLLIWFAVGLTKMFASGLAPLLAVLIMVLAIVEAILFIRVRTRFGYVVGTCCLLFAVGIANLYAPHLYIRFVHPD